MPIVNPRDRAAAAELLLEAVATLDFSDFGTEAADDRLVLALGTIGIDMEASPEFKPVMAAALDIITFLAMREGQRGGASHKMVAKNFQRYVLPQVYPDVYGN